MERPLSGWLPLSWQPTDTEPIRRRIDKITYGVKGVSRREKLPLIYDLPFVFHPRSPPWSCGCFTLSHFNVRPPT